MCLFSTNLILSLPPSTRKGRDVYMYIGGLILALVTIVVLTDAIFLEFMWIDHRNGPGGPLGYLQANSSIWWQTLGTAANQVSNFIGDGLLMYRCFVIYNNNPLVIVFPVILYLGSISMAVMTLIQSAAPGSNFFQGKTVNFGVPWASLSVALNVTLTCLIILRILRARKNARKYFDDHDTIYTSLASILVESSLPFSILGIAFAITYGKTLDEGPAFLFAWSAFSGLSPQFIIFRVATGRAWTRDIASQISRRDSTIVFEHTLESCQLKSMSTLDNSKAARSFPSVS